MDANTQTEKNEGFLDFFDQLEDPRIERCKKHPMAEILLLTLFGILCGCESWEDIEDYGKYKLDFLRRYLNYEFGIPSDDTLRRFFRALNPEKFNELFVGWMRTFLSSDHIDKVIALDGKALRGSAHADNRALYMLTAFATESKLVLAQQKVDTKSNEITAVPTVLAWLELNGAIVTMDAMGCQKKIAQQILDQGGDYLLALKGNQETLSDDVRTYFMDPNQETTDFNETINKGHGRIEERRCWVRSDINWLKEQHPDWAGLRSIVKIQSTRWIGDKIQEDERYYISSLSPNAEHIQKAVREHWAIENSQHWVLDVSFGEDRSRIHLGHAPENIGIIRRIALNMIRMAKKDKRQSIKRFRKTLGWNDRGLESVIDQFL